MVMGFCFGNAVCPKAGAAMAAATEVAARTAKRRLVLIPMDVSFIESVLFQRPV
jgi:hypothetical protein